MERGTHRELMAGGGLYARMFGQAEQTHRALDEVEVDGGDGRARAGRGCRRTEGGA